MAAASNKTGYEPIPDVEKDEGDAEVLYRDFDDEQTTLLLNFDEAIASAHRLGLTIPSVNRDDMVSQGQNWIRSAVAPTVTAACTFVTAIALGMVSEANSIAAVVVAYFPYINAAIVAYSSISPIQRRMVDAVAPVFEKMDDAESAVKASVARVRPEIDSKIDSLQAEVRDVLEPIKPKLDAAAAHGRVLKKLDPDLDIPSTADVDREFDEAQGVIGDRLDEAAKHVSIKEHVPRCFNSSRAFYWRVVFPIVLLAFLLQLGLAFVTEYYFSPGSTAIFPPSRTRMLVAEQRGLSVPNLRGSVVHEMTRAVAECGDNATTDGDIGCDGNDKKAKEDDIDKTGETGGEFGVKENDFREEVGEKISEFKDEVAEEANKVKKSAHELAEEAGQKLQPAAEATISTFKTEVREQFDDALADSKSMVIDVAMSYLMALLQLALIYLVTSPAVKACVTNMIMRKLTSEAERTLREYGVSAGVEEVLGTRMGRVRQQVLKILRAQKKIDDLLEKAGIGSDLSESLASAASAAAETVKKAKESNLLDRLFGRHKK